MAQGDPQDMRQKIGYLEATVEAQGATVQLQHERLVRIETKVDTLISFMASSMGGTKMLVMLLGFAGAVAGAVVGLILKLWPPSH